ncbi:DUF805 domain-containing protein [Brevundimonas sp.]|uniref:DUF805 domain-containing protein n=1 Tax=Brevundimonas sp. TaxID=1871086 RepID=UPI0028A0CD6D|nr:DUF805 domain-containing protein [Brevundimonas sp.]
MRGEILSYDAVSGEGLISGDDLMRYRFSRIDVGGAQEPAPGLRVDFVPLDDRASQIIPLLIQAGGLSPAHMSYGEAPLSMWAYFVRCIREKFIDGDGRARRLEYWSFILFNWLTMMAAFVPFLVLVGLSDDSDPMSALMVLSLLLPVLWTLFLIIPGIALASRRLHDVGLSGWLYLVTFVPYVGGLFMLDVACIPSQPHPNHYGLAPKRF